MTTNQKVAGSSPAERSTESPANRGVLQLSTGSIVINTAEGLEVAFSMPKLKGRDREAPLLYSFECLPLLPEEPAGHEATGHQESARAQREQRSSVATAGLRQLLLLLGLLRGLLFGLLLGFLRLGLPGRGWSRRRLGCRRRSGLRRGSRSRRGFRSRRRSRSSLRRSSCRCSLVDLLHALGRPTGAGRYGGAVLLELKLIRIRIGLNQVCRALRVAALGGALYRSALVSVAPTARDLERLINFAALAFLLVLLLNLCEGRRGGNQHYR